MLASSPSIDFSRTTTFSGGGLAGLAGAALAACSTLSDTCLTMASDERRPSSLRSSV